MKHLIIAMLVVKALSSQELPEGSGKKTVERLCGNCHGIATIVGLRRTKAAWESTVDDMVTRGLTASDSDLDTAVAYLAEYLGKVNVNTATAEEIQRIADLSAADATSIVEYRKRNGPYKDFVELEKVPGLDSKRMQERKDRIAFK